VVQVDVPHFKVVAASAFNLDPVEHAAAAHAAWAEQQAVLALVIIAALAAFAESVNLPASQVTVAPPHCMASDVQHSAVVQVDKAHVLLHEVDVFVYPTGHDIAVHFCWVVQHLVMDSSLTDAVLNLVESL
jgi:hypothetical protein